MNRVSNPTVLKIFCKYGRLGASSRLRFLQFVPELEKHFSIVRVYELLPDAYIRALYSQTRYSKFKVLLHYLERLIQIASIGRRDTVWVEKEFFPYFPAVFENWLKFRGVRLISDYDDAIFHSYDEHPRPIIRKIFKNKIASVMRASEKVFAGNPYIGEYARRAGAKQIIDIPTVVSAAKYLAAVKNQKHADSPVPIIGWIGSPITQKFISQILEAFQTLYLTHPFKLRLIGASLGFGANLPFLEIKPWNEESEVSDLHQIDIGVMPLSDTSFERGKCGYKIIQYMALGKPVVASDVGVNSKIIHEGETGFTVRDLQEWTKSLKILLSSKAVRLEMGHKGYEVFKNHYSSEVLIPKIIRELASPV